MVVITSQQGCQRPSSLRGRDRVSYPSPLPGWRNGWGSAVRGATFRLRIIVDSKSSGVAPLMR
ncbi:hypothetical protein [Subtercola boreus]|uniref:hypothetical protein n=1 Tax=Subtercola boreus TaxID=120213 RepID=UPI0011C030F5|nr:hypothetical protein [Subtercola boreus]